MLAVGGPRSPPLYVTYCHPQYIINISSMSAKKSRFDGLDVAAMTSHVKRTMLGFKLANVYDGNALGVVGTSGASGGGGTGEGARGVYMFKLADPGGGGGGGGGGPASSAAAASSAADAAAPATTAASADNATEEELAGSPPREEDQNQKRAMLLVESGVRFHPTT